VLGFGENQVGILGIEKNGLDGGSTVYGGWWLWG
jgi:hypothetical protein